ncbi:hypothetical protein [Streptomyces sp. NPDC058294]
MGTDSPTAYRAEHQTEDGGIHAAATACRARQAAPGFYRQT